MDKSNYKQHKELYCFSFIILISFIFWYLGIIFGGVESYQFDIYFLRCGNFLADFTNLIGYSFDGDPYNNSVNGLHEKSYPALPYVITKLFSSLDLSVNKSSFLAISNQPQFMAFLIINFMLLAILFFSIVRNAIEGNDFIKTLFAFAVTFSSGMLFAFERANFIIITCLCCLYYVTNYNSQNRYKREMSLLCLAISFALKLSPAILGVLLIYDRRYLDCIKASIYGLLAFVVPFLLFEGGLENINLMFNNMHGLFNKYNDLSGIGLKATIDSFVTLYYSTFNWTNELSVSVRIFSCITSCLFVLTAWLHDRIFDKVLVITLVLFLVPSIAQDYTILYFIPTMICFFNRKEKKQYDIICFMAYCLMCWVFILPNLNSFYLQKFAFILLLIYALTITIIRVYFKIKPILGKSRKLNA